jgi:tetratricopeptide (TPR) repeat protein
MADSQPGRPPSACVDTATIAAFIDGMIDSASRAQVIAHLATCPDCSELVGEIEQTREELNRTAPPVKRFWTPRNTLGALGGFVAIAASLMLIINRHSPLDPLVTIVGDERLTLARPAGHFHYGPLRSPVRGAAESQNFQLAAEVARLRERSAQTGAAIDLHAYGVAQMVSGDTSGAIASLQSAVRLQPNDATFVADLGAALMSRFVERGDPQDATAALESIEKALSSAPSLKEAWFNKALLLERMNRPADAVSAWTRYLELSDDQPWRDEATRNRDAIQRQLGAR